MFTETCTGCAPARRDPSAGKKFRLSEDVWRPMARKRPVGANLLEAPVEELAEPAGLSDPAENRLDDLPAEPARTGESPRLQHHPRQRHGVRALLADLLEVPVAKGLLQTSLKGHSARCVGAAWSHNEQPVGKGGTPKSSAASPRRTARGVPMRRAGV
jgi:hypothetical protein